eukprot:1185361-Prorocentrum_minimum.AAC.1
MSWQPIVKEVKSDRQIFKSQDRLNAKLSSSENKHSSSETSSPLLRRRTIDGVDRASASASASFLRQLVSNQGQGSLMGSAAAQSTNADQKKLLRRNTMDGAEGGYRSSNGAASARVSGSLLRQLSLQGSPMGSSNHGSPMVGSNHGSPTSGSSSRTTRSVRTSPSDRIPNQTTPLGLISGRRELARFLGRPPPFSPLFTDPGVDGTGGLGFPGQGVSGVHRGDAEQSGGSGETAAQV